MIEYGMEHLGELIGFVVRYMDDVFGIQSGVADSYCG